MYHQRFRSKRNKGCNTLKMGHFILELDELYDYVLKKNTIVDINLVGQF